MKDHRNPRRHPVVAGRQDVELHNEVANRCAALVTLMIRGDVERTLCAIQVLATVLIKEYQPGPDRKAALRTALDELPRIMAELRP